jgi:hypothetical protein
MFVGFHVGVFYSRQFLMKIEFSRQNLGKSSNVKFHKNWSSGNGVVLCEQTEAMKLIVALRNFVNAPGKMRGRVLCQENY